MTYKYFIATVTALAFATVGLTASAAEAAGGFVSTKGFATVVSQNDTGADANIHLANHKKRHFKKNKKKHHGAFKHKRVSKHKKYSYNPYSKQGRYGRGYNGNKHRHHKNYYYGFGFPSHKYYK